MAPSRRRQFVGHLPSNGQESSRGQEATLRAKDRKRIARLSPLFEPRHECGVGLEGIRDWVHRAGSDDSRIFDLFRVYKIIARG